MREAAASNCPRLADALRSPLPDAGTRVREAPLLAIDLEMTGLDPETGNIVSIGWVPVDHGAIDLAESMELGVVAGGGDAVGESATIHGIRDCDRSNGVELQQALQRLTDALTGRVAIFHHAPLDTAFLDRALRGAFGIGWAWPGIDTLAWYRRRARGRDPEAGSGPAHLDAVRDHYGLAPRSTHNAVDDAISCAEVALILAARSRARLGDACDLPAGR